MGENISQDLFDLALNIRLGMNSVGASRQLERYADRVRILEKRLEKAESVCYFVSDSREMIEGTTGLVLRASLGQWTEARKKAMDAQKAGDVEESF